MEMRSTTVSDITKTTDEMLQELTGFASVTGVEEIIGGAGDIQSAANLIEVATDVQEGDGKGDTVFHKREDALSGMCTDGKPGSEPILYPQTVSLVPRPNAADTSEAVLALDSNPHPLESEVLFGASHGSADLLSDQSRDLPSGNKGSSPDLVDFKPQAELKEALHRPTTQNSERTEAGLPGLELHQKEGETVISMELTAQERTPFAASVPVPEKEGGRVNGKAQVPAGGPSEELVSKRQKELLEDEEEQEEVTEGAQQQIISEGNCGAQRESPRCRVQSFGEKPSMGGQKATTSDSKYNTVSYRKIRKGNTKQRIDEFESMMH